MSAFMGFDPADYTLDDLRSQADGLATMATYSPCRGCHDEDGELNTELMDEEGACVFGCGRKVDDDMGLCPSCQDHAANVWQCPVCDTEYEKWNRRWERKP